MQRLLAVADETFWTATHVFRASLACFGYGKRAAWARIEAGENDQIGQVESNEFECP